MSLIGLLTNKIRSNKQKFYAKTFWVKFHWICVCYVFFYSIKEKKNCFHDNKNEKSVACKSEWTQTYLQYWHQMLHPHCISYCLSQLPLLLHTGCHVYKREATEIISKQYPHISLWENYIYIYTKTQKSSKNNSSSLRTFKIYKVHILRHLEGIKKF